MAIQWRPEVNALTTPQSYWIRFVPRDSADRKDIATDISLRHPNFSKADIQTILSAEDDAILARILSGEAVIKEGSFSWHPSFTGRLNDPDDPLPPLDECLQVNVRVSPPFLAALRQAAQTERLPLAEKLPLIAATRDTLLDLKDVLNPAGALQLTGDDLSFDRQQLNGCGCVLAGTRSGSTVQTRLLKVEPGEIMLLPDIPAQDAPWNNEYTVSVSTRYSEHGTLRTGICRRKLRTPILWDGAAGTGLLTGAAEVPAVTISSGVDVTNGMLRVQAMYDAQTDALLLSLIDMQEGGQAGAAVSVAAQGEITLHGFSGAAVSSLTVAVEQYSALKELVRSGYSGRLVDILRIELA